MTARSTPTEIIEIVAKYMNVLGVENPPEIAITDNIHSSWLGQCRWLSSRPGTTTIKLQKRILSHPKTLDRVLAHEMIHHWELSSLSNSDLVALRLGIKLESHGQKFMKGAAKVNQFMGDDNYVTRTSDSSYELEANTKKFYLLIMRMSSRNQRLGWAWAAKPSAKAKERIAKECSERDGRLVMSTDEHWLCGTKIKEFGGMSLPPEGSADEEILRCLYDNSPNEYENP